MRRAALLLLSAFTFVALCCPALAGDAPERQDVVVWGLFYGPDSKGDEAAIREFEKRNPSLHVRLLGMGAGGMNPQKLMTAIVGNVAPDVIVQDRFTISDWASRSAFRSLDDLIARDGATDPLCPVPQQYYPHTWNEASWNGQIFAIPYKADDRAFYYNKAIFRDSAPQLRAAGLDPDRPPRTWSELLAYSKAITKKNPDGSIKIAGFMPNWGNSWLYLFAFQMNASFMSPDGRTCTLDSPQSEKALEFIKEGYAILGGYENAKKFESGFLPEGNDAFMIGKVAMKIDGDWNILGISRFHPELEFGTAPPPVPDDRYFRRGEFANEKDQFITWTGGFSMAIPRGARNVEGAWKFIKFFLSEEGRMINMRAQADWERRKGRAFIPSMQAHIETNRKMYAEFKPSQPNIAQALKTHIDLSPVGRVRPVTFVGQKLWDEHVKAMENALYGTNSVKGALLEGQKVVQRELDDYYSRTQFPLIDLRLPAYLGLAAFAVGCAVLFGLYKRLRLGPLSRHEAKWAYLFISPWVLGFVVFTLGPMVASFFYSFTAYDVLNESRWVGLKNYSDLVTSDSANFSKAFANVAYLGGIGVPLSLFTGLAVALLLNAAVRGMRFYRTLFYLPAIVPGVASVILWMFILTPDTDKGILNSLWQSTISNWLGAPAPGWMTVEAWSKPALIVMGLWGAGSGMVLWLAGLKGVPSTLYEAAAIDGASPRQQFWAITLPQLSPIIFFNTVIGIIGAVQTFDSVYVINHGEGAAGPADSLLTPVYMLFRNGFAYFKMGYASSIAWVVFAIILILTLIQFKLAPKWVHYEADS